MDFQDLLVEAESRFEQDDVDRGVALYLQAAEAAEAGGDLFAKGCILSNLALLQEQRALSEEALHTYQAALEILDLFEDTPELIQTLRNLGLLYRNIGQIEDAKRYYEKVLDLAETIGEEAMLGPVRVDLGILLKDQGDLTKAQSHLEETLELLAQFPPDLVDSSTHANALQALGLTHQQLGDVQKAEDYFLQTLEPYKCAQDWENYAIALHNLGQLQDNQANVGEALEYYFRALQINLQNGYQRGMVDNLTNLTSLICTIYQIQDSLFQQPDNALQDLPIGFQDILTVWRQTLVDSLEKIPETAEEGIELIQALTAIDSVDQGVGVYRALFRFYNVMNYPVGEMQALIDLAFIQRSQGQLKAAQKSFSQALSLSQTVGNPDDLFHIYFERGDTYFMAENIETALRDYRSAVACLNSIRTKLLQEEDALGYFDEEKLLAYERLIRITAKQGAPLQAFLWLEQAQSREFIRRLRLTGFQAYSDLPSEHLNQEEQLLEELRQVVMAVENTDGTERIKLLENYEVLEQQLQQFWEGIKSLDTEYVSLRQGSPLNWSDLQTCFQL